MQGGTASLHRCREPTTHDGHDIALRIDRSTTGSYLHGVAGTEFDDVIKGGSHSDFVPGLAGDDRLRGRGG